MAMTRRAMLGLGVAAIGSIAAGCSRAAHTIARSSDTDAAPNATALASQSASRRTGIVPSSTRVDTSPAPRGPATDVIRASTGRDEVALTFHGAGDVGIARELLTIFAAHRATVTVFAVGAWLAANPGIAGEIVAAGHDLGNHTYNHLDIDSLDPVSARAEIVRCRDVLKAQVGSGGRYFRPSQTQHATALVRALAGEAGYPICVSYDIDSLDYTDPGPADVRRNVTAARPGSIVSLHFGHPGTVEAMPLILADLAHRALRPVGVGELLRP